MANNKGRRYNGNARLNYKKVFGALLAIILLIIVIVSFVKLFKHDKKDKAQDIQKRYFTAYDNGKWGVIDQNGDTVLSITYDEMITIPNDKKDIFIYAYDIDETNETYKTKAVNTKGEALYTDYSMVEAIENYDAKQNFWYEDVLKVQKDGKWGLIDLDGQMLLNCEYDAIESLKTIKGNFVIRKDGKVGVCNNKGQTIINPEYKGIQILKEGYKNQYIVIDDNNNYGLIDTTGTVLIEPKYKEIKYLESSELFAVLEDTWKVFNVTSKEVALDLGDKAVKTIKGDNIIVNSNSKYGIMSLSGDQKVDYIYDDLEYAFSIYYIAKKGNMYGIINVNGEEILPFEYLSMYYVSEGAILVADKTQTETAIFDSNLTQKLSGIINEINVEKGYIKLYSENEYKYYNFKFEEKAVSDLLTANTLFLSKKDDKYGYVNKQGDVVVDYIYDDGTEQNAYGFAAVKQNGLWGSIDKIGKVILGPSVNLDTSIYTYFIGAWHLSDDGLYYIK